MRKGTVFKNLWASYESYFIYQMPGRSAKREAKRSSGYVIYNVDGKWSIRRGDFYTCDLEDREHFPIVGHLDVETVLINAVLDIIRDEGADER